MAQPASAYAAFDSPVPKYQMRGKLNEVNSTLGNHSQLEILSAANENIPDSIASQIRASGRTHIVRSTHPSENAENAANDLANNINQLYTLYHKGGKFYGGIAFPSGPANENASFMP